jgi:hypothetical protein
MEKRMSPDHTDAQRQVPNPRPLELAKLARLAPPDVHRTERDRIVTDAILEDV